MQIYYGQPLINKCFKNVLTLCQTERAATKGNNLRYKIIRFAEFFKIELKRGDEEEPVSSAEFLQPIIMQSFTFSAVTLRKQKGTLANHM